MKTNSQLPSWFGATVVEPPQDSVDEALAYLVGQGVDIRLKTCQEWIDSNDVRYPNRAGRFNLDADEYETLLDSGGFYLFLVKSDDNVIAGRLIPAQDITFRKQVTWRDTFDG